MSKIDESEKVSQVSSRRLFALGRLVLLFVLAIALVYWLFGWIKGSFFYVHETDARVMADLITISSEVEGRIVRRFVSEGNNIKKGDPYQWQVEQSVDKIVKALNIKELDWILSYQSRVGPLKWIGPSTEDIIVENSKLGKHIVLVPIAFVSEHSETLVELDIEYKELADKNGCKNYSRVPALGTNENYIKAMSNLIINKHDYNFNGELFPPKLQCPNQFKKCPCLSYE